MDTYSSLIPVVVLEKQLARIKQDPRLNKEDARDIAKYTVDMRAKEITISRLVKCVVTLKNIAIELKSMKTSFRKASDQKLKQLVISFDADETISVWTKHDKKVILKRFYKWLFGKDEEYPKRIKWIKSREPKNNILPEDLLTDEEVLKLIDATNSLRNKAFIHTLYESGARLGEMRSLRIKDITFADKLTSIMVKGKTGQRRIPLIASTGFLANWINIHPYKNDPDSSLWIALRESHHMTKHSINSRTIKDILQNAAKKSGIKKRVNPHSFRHARATDLAKKLTEAQLKQFFGWVQSSRMASQYVHLSGRDLDNAVLKIYGIENKEEDNKIKITNKNCYRCQTSNPNNFKLCRKCGATLNEKEILESTQNKPEQNLEFLQNIIQQIEKLENKGLDIKKFSKFLDQWSEKQETT